jgi:hypothetical protein
MALARFKDLCIDAVDPARLGASWAALGLRGEALENGDMVLRGERREHSVWINRVPEPKSVKHRVHLDVHGSSPDDLLALGARVLDDRSFRWGVMADPEGGEFCLFPRDEVPAYRLYELGVDCADHEALARWWADALGARWATDAVEGVSYVEDVPGLPFDGIAYGTVPEPKTVKNRIHLDVVAEDLDALLDAGAVLVRRRDDEIGWDVLADPEGNEFCRFEPS